VITVSGLTRIKQPFQPLERRKSKSQRARSQRVRGRRPGRDRSKTMSGCLRARISAARAARERKLARSVAQEPEQGDHPPSIPIVQAHERVTVRGRTPGWRSDEAQDVSRLREPSAVETRHTG